MRLEGLQIILSLHRVWKGKDLFDLEFGDGCMVDAMGCLYLG